MFTARFRLREVKPHFVPDLPDLPPISKANTETCSFCHLVFQIGTPNLTPEDKAKFSIHLKLAHGLRPEITV